VSSPPSRLAFLDLAKGILVILMVVYHSLNYTNEYHLAFRYLSFLPPSFILITGFLIAIAYYPRYARGDSTVWLRLLTRGAKLLGLFIALNIVAQFVRSPVYGQSMSMGVVPFFRNWHEVFVIGSGPAVAFEVLLPIAYLLLLSPFLLWLAHRHVALLPGLTLAVIAAAVLLDLRGQANANVSLLSAGLIGIVAGRFLPNAELIGRPLIVALIGYAIYFPASLAKGYVYLIQLSGACVALVLICSVSHRLGETGRGAQFLVRQGQYSLLAYIVQIGALQMLSRVLGRPDPVSVDSLILFGATMFIMVAATEVAIWARGRFQPIDTAYRAVFA
jgi:peptidoglycan/LPS O-acetylase OafA/YrhL